MKNKKNKVKKTPVIIAMALFCSLSLLCAKMNKRRGYTEPEIKTFWDVHLDNLYRERIILCKHKFPEINERIKKNMGEIKKKYGQDMGVTMTPTYFKASKDISAGCDILRGKPTVILVVPTIMDQYYELDKKDPLWKEKFENSLVIGFIHELDHLAHETASNDEPELEQLVSDEKKVWAITCEKTIRIFKEHGAPISNSDDIYYTNWIKCGRNENSQIWHNFIFRHYSTTRK